MQFEGMKTRSMNSSIMPPPPPRDPRTISMQSTSTGFLQSMNVHAQQQSNRNVSDRIRAPPRNPRKRKKGHDRNESKSSKNSHPRRNSFKNQYPTELQTFHSSDHGHERRVQRNIGKRDIQKAKKHGKRRPGVPRNNGDTTTIYELDEITYIENNRTKREITSWRNKKLESKSILLEDLRRNDEACRKISHDESTWISHSVCVVDTSGSMRKADVVGCRTRLKAVWYAIAVDFIQHRIESGEATDMDVVTIIVMGETSSILFERQPTNWIFFNKLVSLYNGDKVPPAGHGNFLPSLRMTEQILLSHKSSSCVLNLFMFTDGRPSDREYNREALIQERIASLSSRLGKRFTVATVGIGSATEFETLKKMTETAKDFGSEGLYQVPHLSREGLCTAISTIATSVAATRIGMTVFGDDGLKQHKMKTVRNVTRERLSTIPAITEEVDPEEFLIYSKDKVTHKLYDPGVNGDFKDAPLLHPEAAGVAVCKKAFGEGTERIVYQFFEITSDGKTVAGDPLVAKESRFLEDYGNDEASKEKYVRQFCRLQHKAKEIADVFNKKLNSLKILHKDTPRISFLDCSVYYLDNDQGGEQLLLVEKRLHQNFQKWNNNNGDIFVNQGSTQEMIIIGEEEEENKDNDKENVPDVIITDNVIEIVENNEIEMHGSNEIQKGKAAGTLRLKATEVAQAFSHFSYTYSEKCLICDLQGSYDGVSHIFNFTDPVIHYHNRHKCDKKNLFGRTDLGKKGIDKFLETHECNRLCELLNNGLRNHR